MSWALLISGENRGGSRLLRPKRDWRIPDKGPFLDTYPGDPGKARTIIHTVEQGQAARLWDEHPDFRWLRDLRSYGGDTGRKAARTLLETAAFKTQNRRHQDAFQFHAPAALLAFWGQYDFLIANSDLAWAEEILPLIAHQAQLLLRIRNRGEGCAYEIARNCALIVTGLSLGVDKWEEQGLERLKHTLEQNMFPDGGLRLRNPAEMTASLHPLLETANALRSAGKGPPHLLIRFTERLGLAVRALTLGDQDLAQFQGATRQDPQWLSHMLKQMPGPNKTVKDLPDAGYARLSKGRSVIVMDTGGGGPNCAPLAINFCAGRDRLITGCGARPGWPGWDEALARAAAHSTLDTDTDISAPQMAACDIERQEESRAAILSAATDQYLAKLGFRHWRRLCLLEGGKDLRGEDSLEALDYETLARAAHQKIALRFHLHPRVQASSTLGGHEFWLKLPTGHFWSFRAAGPGITIALEDSVYCPDAHSRAQKTSQIVVTTVLGTAVSEPFRWSLKQVR